jgi:phosphoribosylformylglycinamidine synthase PurS subunit
MKAKVYVTLKSGVLDPQGQAVARALGRLGFAEVRDARIGKYIEMQLADDVKDPEAHLKQMCEKLLANTVIEEYRYEIVK